MKNFVYKLRCCNCKLTDRDYELRKFVLINPLFLIRELRNEKLYSYICIYSPHIYFGNGHESYKRCTIIYNGPCTCELCLIYNRVDKLFILSVSQINSVLTYETNELSVREN